ncbi:MAG: ankyrin repeat domain-containing protein [Candidatus Aminicenantes bacterium]|jgi:ankyrin repeat protein/Tfp pilus assembly protein PilF
MEKSHNRPIGSDIGEPHSSALYKVKKPLLTLKQKIIIVSSIIILVVITIFIIRMLEERQKAEIKAKEANFSFAKVLKEKAKKYAEIQQWQLVKLFTVNSMVYQAKAQQFIPMQDIKLPLELEHNQLKYLTYQYRTSYPLEEVKELLKEVEQQTGLVLDGATPVSTDIYYSLDLDYYKNSSQYNSAIEAYNAANDFYNSGSTDLDQQKYHEAIANFVQALKIRPHFKEALNKLGWAYILNGNRGKSKKIYQKAKKMDLDYYIQWNSKQWADLGRQQKNNGDYVNAIHSYKEALKINPTYYRAWNRLGETYEKEIHFDRAIKLYNQALRALPHLTREWRGKILYNQALKHHSNAQYQDAVENLKKSIEVYPQLDRAWIKLADAFRDQKGEQIVYRGDPGDFYFKQTDLKLVIIFIARQTGISAFIDPEVSGEITCELDQVKWDKALDLFLKIHNYHRVRIENTFIIGQDQLIEKFLKKKAALAGKDKKAFSGKPLDLSFFGADIHFVLQEIAAKAALRIIVDPGINHSITCEIYQLHWDMALDFLLEMNGLSCFRFNNLIRIGRKEVLEEMCKSEAGILEIFQSLLELDPRQVDFKDKKGKTLLFFAAEKGFAQLAAFLISKGAKVNTRDKWNFTPLHEALNKETAEVLINKGAFLNVKSNSGLTPLQRAVYGLRLDVARFLVSKGATSNIFLDAAIGRFERIQQQVQRNPKIVNNADVDGWTLLHHAAVAGQYKIVDLLISKSANINAQTIKGETPLHLAVSQGRKKIVKLLILKGARVNIKNKYGHTPLHIAKTNGDRKSAKLLEKYGGGE